MNAVHDSLPVDSISLHVFRVVGVLRGGSNMGMWISVHVSNGLVARSAVHDAAF